MYTTSLWPRAHSDSSNLRNEGPINIKPVFTWIYTQATKVGSRNMHGKLTAQIYICYLAHVSLGNSSGWSRRVYMAVDTKDVQTNSRRCFEWSHVCSRDCSQLSMSTGAVIVFLFYVATPAQCRLAAEPKYDGTVRIPFEPRTTVITESCPPCPC